MARQTGTATPASAGRRTSGTKKDDRGRIKLRKTRYEKAEETRRALFSAAEAVVGQVGYAEASVSRITDVAQVANGTFYNYFDSRQDLFDQLLPAMGEKLLVYIRAQLSESDTGLERERKRIRAYFEFCKRNPGFLRILSEAIVFAPDAYRMHVKRFYEGYVRALHRSLGRGEVRGYSERELDAIVFMLMGARAYLTMLYSDGYLESPSGFPEEFVEIYAKFVDRALFSGAGADDDAASNSS